MFRSRTMPTAMVLSALCLLSGIQLLAQEHPGEEQPAATHAAEDGHGEHEGGVEVHKNAAGLVLGGTWESEEDETYFTIGAEYSRELSHRWSLGFVGEYLDDLNAWVFVLPANYLLGRAHPHPRGHFSLTFGPGLEHKSRRPHDSHGEGGGHESEHGAGPMDDVGEEENLFLWRTGIRYTIHMGRYEVVPALDLDLVRENGEWVEAVVFDVGLGLGF